MRLPRRLSMTRREEFAAVRKSGESLATRNFVMATLPHSHSGLIKFGLITSRRAARRAVVRNRIRRHLRAILINHGDKLESGRYLVMVARRKAGEASFQELEADWLRLARRLGILQEDQPMEQNPD
jgi:ribonuclease P protein component